MFGYKPNRRERMMAAEAYERSRQIGEAFGQEGDAWMTRNVRAVVDDHVHRFRESIERIDQTSRLSPITSVRTELALFLSTLQPLRLQLEEKTEVALAHWKKRLIELGHPRAFQDYMTSRLDAVALPAYVQATDLAMGRIADLKAQGFQDEYTRA